MRNRWIGLTWTASIVLLGLSPTGCMSEDAATLESLVAGIADAATSATGEADATASSLLGQGVRGRGPGGPGRAGGPRPEITEEQRTQLDALRAAVDAGEITHEQARAQAEAILGVDLPDGPGPGGPGTQPRGQRIAEALGLTDEQRTAADEIFEAARTDVRTLHDASREQFRALLTPEQITLLDEIEATRGRAHHAGSGTLGAFPGAFGAGAGPMPPHGRRHGGLPPGGAPLTDGATPPTDSTPQDREARHEARAARLAEALGLTQEQQDAFAAIRAETRSAIRARREQAREAFRALLTAEQLATLDQLEAQHGAPD